MLKMLQNAQLKLAALAQGSKITRWDIQCSIFHRPRMHTVFEGSGPLD